MKKNDLIKTEDGIYRILSIEANIQHYGLA